MRKYYPDISHYRKVTDWGKVKQTCPFIICKATQGTSFVDPTLKEFIDGCEKNEIPYWLYCYLNKGDELPQAEFMVKTCEPLVGNFFVGYALDVEADNTYGGVKKALEFIKTKRPKALLYIGRSFYEKDLFKNIIINRGDNVAFWQARYGKNDGLYETYDYNKYPISPGVDLHQYTSAGNVPGIDKPCDCNMIIGGNKDEAWYTTVAKEEKEEKAMAYTAAAVIAEARKWEGYLEKSKTGTDAQLQSKTWSPGEKNITWFWQWLYNHGLCTKSYLVGAAWCDAFNDYCHAVVGGIDKATKSLGGFSYYTPTSASYYKKAGRWIPANGTPKAGDQIFFKNSTRIYHTGIVTEVTSSKVYTIEGNTSSASGVVENGGCVREKSYSRSYSAIAGYGRPLYDFESNPDLSKGSKGDAVGELQTMLNKVANAKLIVDKDFGSATQKALLAYQKSRGLDADGIYGQKSRAALVADYSKAMNGFNQCVKDFEAWSAETYPGTSKKAIGRTLNPTGYWGENENDKYVALAIFKYNLNDDYNADDLYLDNHNWTKATDEAAARAVLQKGTTANHMTRILKVLLAAQGFYLGKFDGVFDDEVEQAVYAEQKHFGLGQNGKVERRDWKCLFGFGK